MISRFAEIVGSVLMPDADVNCIHPTFMAILGVAAIVIDAFLIVHR
jgi:hypothetical protein